MQIKELEIFTAKLKEQIQFYRQVLALDVIEETSISSAFQIGRSILRFTYREACSPYHYAINIPANQEQEALTWLKERVDIITNNEHEIQYFDFWNAYAIYFYDKDNNIVELIARKNLSNESTQPFGKNSLLEIGEIGLPTFDIRREYQLLKDVTGIPIHSGNLERFCAIGDDHGLFIAINKKLKREWFPTKDEPVSADFKIKFIQQGQVYSFAYEKEVLKVLENGV